MLYFQCALPSPVPAPASRRQPAAGRESAPISPIRCRLPGRPRPPPESAGHAQATWSTCSTWMLAIGFNKIEELWVFSLIFTLIHNIFNRISRCFQKCFLKFGTSLPLNVWMVLNIEPLRSTILVRPSFRYGIYGSGILRTIWILVLVYIFCLGWIWQLQHKSFPYSKEHLSSSLPTKVLPYQTKHFHAELC